MIDLERPGADWCREPWGQVTETHSAVVFFAGDRAYKLKKPVSRQAGQWRSRASSDEDRTRGRRRSRTRPGLTFILPARDQRPCSFPMPGTRLVTGT